MEKRLDEQLKYKEQKALASIKISRVIFPIILGVLVVAYLMWEQYNPKEFAEIDWSLHTFLWIGASLCLLIVRHLAYATRLKIVSDGEFSWSKCIELIFIWEFSSAVSPTSVGGSAVALFVLSQEKMSTGKTAAIVIYTATLDALFFISTLPILYSLFGTQMIRPNIDGQITFDGWGYAFLTAYIVMLIYGLLFFYGLFINAKSIKNILLFFTRLKWLKKFKEKTAQLGDDIITASEELKHKNWNFHLSAFFSTATAWSCRFLLLNCLIIGFSTDEVPLVLIDQLGLYSRLEAMFVIMAFSPTPGGAGFAELVFFGFTSDFISQKSISLLVASIWRLFTYYAYLLIGVIIIPNWIKNLLEQKKELQ